MDEMRVRKDPSEKPLGITRMDLCICYFEEKYAVSGFLVVFRRRTKKAEIAMKMKKMVFLGD